MASLFDSRPIKHKLRFNPPRLYHIDDLGESQVFLTQDLDVVEQNSREMQELVEDPTVILLSAEELEERHEAILRKLCVMCMCPPAPYPYQKEGRPC